MKEELRQALMAIKERDEETARLILSRLLQDDPDNIRAWILLGKMAHNDTQRTAFLNKVLQLDPNNIYAKNALQEIKEERVVARADDETAPGEEVELPAGEAVEEVTGDEPDTAIWEVTETADVVVEESEPVGIEGAAVYEVEEAIQFEEEPAAAERTTVSESLEETGQPVEDEVELEEAERVRETAESSAAAAPAPEPPDWLDELQEAEAPEPVEDESEPRVEAVIAGERVADTTTDSDLKTGDQDDAGSWLLPVLGLITVVVFILLLYALFDLFI